MDTVGIEVPKVARRFDRRLAAVAAVVTAAACLVGGYALGSSSDAASSAPIIARGTPATWGDALRESVAVKRHAADAAAAEPLDFRRARLER